MDNIAPVKLFISYSHADESLKNEFLKQLSPLKRQGLVDTWVDEEILAGDHISKEISDQLLRYDIIIFLVSPDFLSSDYCYNIELTTGLERRGIDRSRIFPVIVRSCQWLRTPLKEFKAVPKDGRAVTSCVSQDDAWNQVVDSLSEVIENYQRVSVPDSTLDEIFTAEDCLQSTVLQEFIEDTEIAYLHNHKESVSLSDIYVFPDVRDPEEYSDQKNITQSGECVLDSSEKKILVLGGEQSGKTSLAKKYIERNISEGIFTVYIHARTIKKTDVRKIVVPSLKVFYPGLSFEEFQRLAAKKAIIIDDYTEISLNHKFQSRLVSNLEKSFDFIIVTSDRSLKYSEYEYVHFSDFKKYEIKDFGHVARAKLIEKWCSMGQEEVIDPNLLLAMLDSSKMHVDSMLKKNIVPAKPVFILIILQSLGAFKQTDFGLTSYGHCYQELIFQNFSKAKITSDEIDSYINYITGLAYFIFEAGGNSVSEDKLCEFQTSYSQRYIMSGTHEYMLDKLVSSHVIRMRQGLVSFSYKYVFYFYAAKYIADNIKRDDVKDKVEFLCERIHSEKHGNILIFLTHHSKDPNIVDEIRLFTSTIFEAYTPATLGQDDLLHLKGEMDEIPSLVMKTMDVERVRQERLQLMDDEGVAEELESDDDELQEDDTSEFNKMLSDVTKSAKSVEIIGQILRNRQGSMRKEELFELAFDAYSSGLRYLKFYFSLVEKHRDDLIEIISELIMEKGVDDIERVERMARRFLLSSCYAMSLGVVGKVAHSIGTNKLVEVFDEIERENQEPSFRLINLAIRLDFKKEIPKAIIEKMKADFEGNILCYRMLQEVVIQHIYMHYVDYNDKQWIANVLDIPMETQRMVEGDHRLKKMSRI